MVNVVGSSDNYDRWKPDKFKDHLTMTELCKRVRRSRDRIKQLEKTGAIPKPIRVKVGRLKVRLYSPEEVAKIEEHFKHAKPGRPKS